MILDGFYMQIYFSRPFAGAYAPQILRVTGIFQAGLLRAEARDKKKKQLEIAFLK